MTLDRLTQITSVGIASGITLTGVTSTTTLSATTILAASSTVGSAVTINSSGINAGIITATNFSGNVTGNLTGNVNATGLSTFSGGINAGIITATGFVGNLTGNVNSTGVSTFTNGPVLIGSGSSTGTALQRLQVTGGAYISDSFGIGITNPQTALHLGGGGNIRLNRSDNSRSSIIFHNNDGFNINANTVGDDVIINAGNVSGRILLQNNSSSSLIAQSGTVLIGSASSTGTVSQRLQVTGGAYVSGNFGIGTTNPRVALHANGNIIGYVSGGSGILYTTYGALSSGQVLSYNNNLLGYNLRGYVSSLDGGSATNDWYTMYTAPYGYSGIEQAYGGFINFYTSSTAYQSTTANATVSPPLAMTIAPGGNVTLSNGNLVIGTSGKGIDFSAASNAAGMTSELLNDYEEGSWTPVWESSGALPTISYSTQEGRYTKIGRVVHFWARIFMSSWGSGGSGNIRMGGLPFTSANTESGHALCHVVFTYSGGNSTWPTGATQVMGEVQPNTTYIEYISLGTPTNSLGENGQLQWSSNPQMYNNFVTGSYWV